MSRSFDYWVTVEYAGRIELDDADLAEFEDDEDLMESLRNSAADEVLSGFAPERDVVETDVTEAVSA
jgi:hypothetical protein